MTKPKILIVGLVVILTAGLGIFFTNKSSDVPTTEVTNSSLEIPAGIKPEAVVLAAVLIENGDIATAVEEGLVSPEEVELARKAIAENTLQDWVNAAENK